MRQGERSGVLGSTRLRRVLVTQDIMALSASYATRPAEQETINDPTNPQHYW